jgi:DNA-binding transcriptional LysR family regulator
MSLRLEWLQTFLVIVETGSLTRAGERVGRSQSAVSLQLRRLEEVVGTTLFERDTRRVRLTAAGERLVPKARRALAAADGAIAAVRGEERRTVRVGLPEEYADALIPGLLEGAGREDPRVALEVHCAASNLLERRLGARQLDLVFALADEIGARGALVFTDPIVWLQAPGSDLAARRPLPVALFDQACSWRNRAIEALECAAIDYRVAFTSASVAGVRAGIRAGFAVGALAQSTAGDELERIRGGDAPPPLPMAELVLLRGDAQDEDVARLVARVRQHHLAG